MLPIKTRHPIPRFFPLTDDLLVRQIDTALKVVAKLQCPRAEGRVERTNGLLSSPNLLTKLAYKRHFAATTPSTSNNTFLLFLQTIQQKLIDASLPLSLLGGQSHSRDATWPSPSGLGQKLSTTGAKPVGFHTEETEEFSKSPSRPF